MSTYMTSYMRQNGSPNITYTGDELVGGFFSIFTPQFIFTDFVVVQSAWGMTQGFVMPFSGFLINAIGAKVRLP